MNQLLASINAVLPFGQRLPKFQFDGKHEWTAESRDSVGYGLTMESALYSWAEGMKSAAQDDHADGFRWEPVLKLLEPYAPPIDTTYPITFSETGL